MKKRLDFSKKTAINILSKQLLLWKNWSKGAAKHGALQGMRDDF